MFSWSFYTLPFEPGIPGKPASPIKCKKMIYSDYYSQKKKIQTLYAW